MDNILFLLSYIIYPIKQCDIRQGPCLPHFFSLLLFSKINPTKAFQSR